jgi:cyclic pyranopterin phosphate synthase
MSGLSDSFQRPVNYLRISVTDRCNLRCFYCMPPQGIPLLPRDEVLSYEEIHMVVQAAAELGIAKVRLSGGEPLVRDGLAGLVEKLSRIEGIDDLSLTTNGVLLRQQAEELRRAGLRRVNVSLDTLQPARFRQITGYDRLKEVLQGIEAARRAGLEPVKVNMVVMRGVNDDELLDFARLTVKEGWHVRFVELMPLVERFTSAQSFMSAGEIRQLLAPLGELEPCLPPAGNGPAKYYRLPGAEGTLGFITPVSEHFCFGCNRLRLTARGKLYPCLLAEEEVDLRETLRRGASREEIKQLIQQAVALKPVGHRLAQGLAPRRGMSQVGG